MSSVWVTDSTPSMKLGNSSNCVHWLYTVWSGRSISIDSLTVAILAPFIGVAGTRTRPPER